MSTRVNYFIDLFDIRSSLRPKCLSRKIREYVYSIIVLYDVNMTFKTPVKTSFDYWLQQDNATEVISYSKIHSEIFALMEPEVKVFSDIHGEFSKISF